MCVCGVFTLQKCEDFEAAIAEAGKVCEVEQCGHHD